ncbi:MAG: hypothetical protein ABSA22_09290, partial [Acidimicrobiales bacterium]
MRRTLIASLVFAMALGVAPLSSTPVGALRHQRTLSACNAFADSIAGTSRSGQLITVTAPTLGSQHATLEFFIRQGGCFRLSGIAYSALVGR